MNTEPLAESKQGDSGFHFLSEQKPDYTVRFFADNKEIGCFDFNQTPTTFTGDVDESAKKFCEAVIAWMPKIAKQTDSHQALVDVAKAVDELESDWDHARFMELVAQARAALNHALP